MDCLYAPLIKFLIRINFAEIENPTIETISNISKKLSEEGYSEPTKIRLISSKGLDPQLVFVPLKFVSEEEGNEILIFRDSIHFTYNDKYSQWSKILPKILENFFCLSEELEISLIENISLDYIDLFNQFPKKGFDIELYFNISLNFLPEFDINYEDFIIGLKLDTEESHHNSILRIRGLKPNLDEFYKIQLETHYNITEDIEAKDNIKLKSNLNYAHDILIKYFKLVLSEKTKKMIVMDNGTNSQ